jgi:hypothetical protein
MSRSSRTLFGFESSRALHHARNQPLGECGAGWTAGRSPLGALLPTWPAPPAAAAVMAHAYLARGAPPPPQRTSRGPPLLPRRCLLLYRRRSRRRPHRRVGRPLWSAGPAAFAPAAGALCLARDLDGGLDSAALRCSTGESNAVMWRRRGQPPRRANYRERAVGPDVRPWCLPWRLFSCQSSPRRRRGGTRTHTHKPLLRELLCTFPFAIALRHAAQYASRTHSWHAASAFCFVCVRPSSPLSPTRVAHPSRISVPLSQSPVRIARAAVRAGAHARSCCHSAHTLAQTSPECSQFCASERG